MNFLWGKSVWCPLGLPHRLLPIYPWPLHVPAQASGGAGGTIEQLPIPTLETLESSDIIQRQVQARLAHITEGVSAGGDFPESDII